MKRIFSTILVAAALLAASVQASAQYFDHLSVGVGAGFDGVSLQLGVPVGNYMQFRAGGSYLPPFGLSRDIPEFEYQPGEKVALSVMGQLQISAFNAMLDLFPGRKTGFHFTVGLFAGDRVLANIHNTKPYLDESSWGTDGIMIGDVMVTTDEKGVSRINMDVNKFLPYLGIGTGRAAFGKSVNIVFDLGAVYTGGIGVYTNGTNVKTGASEYIRITGSDLAGLGFDDKGWLDKFGSFPVLPMLKFTMFFGVF